VVWLGTPKAAQKTRNCGEYFRQHNHSALEISAKQVAQMDAHYAKHGIHCGHRPKKDGKGYEPACVSKRDFERCIAARGMGGQNGFEVEAGGGG
jgi:hypothetical protein